jgi:hypothetical protein
MIETDSAGFPVVVEDLDPGRLLGLVEEAEAQSRAAERRKLRYAIQWCALHPAADADDAATWGDLAVRDRDCDIRIGGDGTPDVGAFTVEPFAAALGISTAAGLQLLSDGLDLVHRLPRAWELVEDLEVAPWRARRLAKATSSLSKEAAAYVDAQLAPILDSCGPTRIDKIVDEARARFDAVEQAEEEDAQRASWGVRLAHGPSGRFAGTSWLEITGDTPTLTRLHHLINSTAHELLDPQDPASADLDQRKVRAVGVIVDRAIGATGGTSGQAAKLYLHLDAQALLEPTVHVGHAEGLGPVTTGLLRDWLQDSRVTIQPVLDLGRDDAVDEHDPPAWMRELVVLRDRVCVFPFCHRSSRDCDLDHIEAFVEMDDGGPPGQTRPDNLAPLCRGHHRAKTFGGWRYVRSRDGTYTWRSPHGRHFIVSPSGTASSTRQPVAPVGVDDSTVACSCEGIRIQSTG